MGTPVQEEFALDLKALSRNKLIFTCGGFFPKRQENLIFIIRGSKI